MQYHDVVIELRIVKILIGLVMILIVEPEVVQKIYQ